VTTHERSVRLPRSDAITGSAVARMVWSRTAGSIASTIAANGMPTPAARDSSVVESVIIFVV